jgi:hypothetical protein
MSAPDILNREHWLERLVQAVLPLFREADLGCPPVHISTGFPSRNALGKGKRRIGECWDGLQSSSGHPHIFISPLLVAPLDVAATVVHELVHAAIGCEHGHKAPFKKAMVKVGLTGKATATEASEELKERLLFSILPPLGAYPHAGLTFVAKDKKQTCRQLKVKCAKCGYTARTTKQWLQQLGPPLCPCNQEAMEQEEQEQEEAA